MLRILAEVSVYAVIIYIAVILLKKGMYKRLSPALHYGIWLLLIARLMMPFTIETGFDLVVIPQPRIEAPQIIPDMDTAPASTQSDAAEPGPAADVLPSLPGQRAGGAAARPSTPSLGASDVSAGDMALALWIAGIAAAFAYMTVSYILLRRRIARNAVPAEGRMLVLFEACREELGSRRGIRVMGLPGLATPALCIPSTVLIPLSAFREMDERQIRFAYRHELMHLRRGDHVMGIILSVLQAVYWFNPVVWIAFRQIRADMEAACDSAVVRHFSGDDKSRYATMILSLFAGKPRGLMLGMARGNTKRAA